MSEFKFVCPVCGQHIKCDSSQSGSTMECPTCFQKITAPQAPATDDPKFILTGTKVGERPVPAAMANAGTATPPAPEKDSYVPAIVLVVLLCAAAVALYAFRGIIFKSDHGAADASGNPPQTAPGRSAAGASSSGGGNLVLNKPVFASSQEANNPSQNGNDGDGGTRWCAQNGSPLQWWKVDLGATAVITNTRVQWEQNSVYRYKIEVSSDNANWTMAVNQTANVTLAHVSSDICSATGRYVRITVTGLPPNTWASFFEFQVFGTVGGSGEGGASTNGSSTHQQ